jgi:ribose-phosphate pyrophosphokinase
MVSPDVGGVVRARALAKRLDCGLAIIDKRREQAGVSEVMHVIGDVSGKVCVMVDDIVDSGGTLCNAAQALKDHGAREVYAYVVHGVLSGGAVARISSSALEKLVTTDSIAATEAVRGSNSIEQLAVAPLIGEAIKRISQEESISELFK